MVQYTRVHLTVAWPADADLEDALERWGFTKQDLYNIWPNGSYDEILNDLTCMDALEHSTNIARDASIFAYFLEH